MAASEKKYAQYKAIIDPLLEAPAAARITLNAARRGDRIDIQTEVADLAQPGANCKLHLLLVEESVRYVGSNGIRFHHQVVRTAPLGAEGTALTEKTASVKASIDLAELRGKLNHYLDDYAANRRPFPHPDRPLDLKALHVIALVQDDQSKEILQAKQVAVTGETAAK
jgi:hypothetical protein